MPVQSLRLPALSHSSFISDFRLVTLDLHKPLGRRVSRLLSRVSKRIGALKANVKLVGSAVAVKLLEPKGVQ